MSHYGEGPAGTTLHVGEREECLGPDCGPVVRPASRRGTTNGNARGGSEDRRKRREWLVRTYRADCDVSMIVGLVFPVPLGTDGALPACRCYRCGVLLTEDTVTVDRIVPGCRGGTYRRSNIRPACGACNSSTGGRTRGRK
jgi:5-methylcytosine-specific restriction endonuclease McrA